MNYQRKIRSNVTSLPRVCGVAALCAALLPAAAWADWNPVSTLAADGTLTLAAGTADEEIILLSDAVNGPGPQDDTLEITYIDANDNVTEESHPLYSGGVQIIVRVVWQAGAGDDLIDYDHGNGSLPLEVAGGEGDDELSGGSADDVLLGGPGDDTLVGADGDDTLEGGLGADTIYGYGGNDTIKGGYGADYLSGGDGDDTILSGEVDGTFPALWFDNADEIHGGDGADYIEGGVGGDVLYGGDWGDPDGDDVLLGGSGNDWMSGNFGDDMLDGGPGSDLLAGDEGNDQLFGGLGGDFLVGGLGEDELDGGHDGASDYLLGDDFASGTPKSADTFYQHLNSASHDEDSIGDYNPRFGDVILYSRRSPARAKIATTAADIVEIRLQAD
jgi:Ca2+-binding RTX toxin-like protein